MRLLLIGLLLQVPGVLTGPDPAQMEKAPDLGYRPVQTALQLPATVKLGAPSSVGVTKQGHLIIFNRGDHPLVEVDANGRFVRSFGEGLYMRPHGLRIDAQGNIWTTDVNAHTVRKMDAQGKVLLTISAPLVQQPNDVAIGPGGEIFVAQGHGMDQPRVSKFDKTGKLITSWGTMGTGPAQFDIAHSIVIDPERMVYVADRQNRRVQVFDYDGRYVKEWKYAGLPCGLFMAPNTQMYLLTGFSGQILKIDRNGKAMAATGQPGKGLGEFGEAHYMALGPKDEIYVADTVNAVLHTFVKTAATQTRREERR